MNYTKKSVRFNPNLQTGFTKHFQSLGILFYGCFLWLKTALLLVFNRIEYLRGQYTFN